jgi:hypothetical protein
LAGRTPSDSLEERETGGRWDASLATATVHSDVSAAKLT